MGEQKKQFLVDMLLKVQSPPGYLETVLRGLMIRLPLITPNAPAEFEDFVKEKLGEDFVKDELGIIYSDYFDEKELQQMIDYWVSDVGTKARSLMLVRQLQALPDLWSKKVEGLWKEYQREFSK